jgi:hypothetical protein
VAVGVAEGVQLSELLAKSSSQAFEVKVDGPDAKTRGYLLTITPKPAKKPAWGVITLRAKIAPSGEKTTSVYVTVR